MHCPPTGLHPAVNVPLSCERCLPPACACARSPFVWCSSLPPLMSTFVWCGCGSQWGCMQLQLAVSRADTSQTPFKCQRAGVANGSVGGSRGGERREREKDGAQQQERARNSGTAAHRVPLCRGRCVALQRSALASSLDSSANSLASLRPTTRSITLAHHRIVAPRAAAATRCKSHSRRALDKLLTTRLACKAIVDGSLDHWIGASRAQTNLRSSAAGADRRISTRLPMLPSFAAGNPGGGTFDDDTIPWSEWVCEWVRRQWTEFRATVDLHNNWTIRACCVLLMVSDRNTKANAQRTRVGRCG